MTQYIDKSALVAEIERLKSIQLTIFSKGETEERCYDSLTYISVYNEILSFLDNLEVKEVNLEQIIFWFDHIAQIADDRKTLNGDVMEDWHALDEIKCLARNSSEFIQRHYKAQKGE